MDEQIGFNLEEVLLFMKSAPANIFFKDTECKYRFASEICALVNGGKENSIIGKTDKEIQKNKELGQLYYEDDLKIIETGKGSDYISEFPFETGSLYYEIRKNPVFHQDKIIGIIGIVTDVTKQIRLEKELEELSFTDKLTGLYNRNYMEVRSKNYVRKDDFPTSLIMIDCNYLKEVNDHLGHEYGDLLLQRITNSIQETISKESIAIRVGGDEFLILCPHHDHQQAEKLIEQLRESFHSKTDNILKLDAAFGYYTAMDDTLPFKEAFHIADKNMYAHKKIIHQQRNHK